MEEIHTDNWRRCNTFNVDQLQKLKSYKTQWLLTPEFPDAKIYDCAKNINILTCLDLGDKTFIEDVLWH